MARRVVVKYKEDLNENCTGVDRFVYEQNKRSKHLKPVMIDTAVRTFILVPKNMPAERIERLKLKYKNNIEERK